MIRSFTKPIRAALAAPVRGLRRVRRAALGRSSRDHARGARPDVPLPFDMFEEIRTARETKSARKLEGIYHKGQAKAWDGKDVLTELVGKHGAPELPERQREAIQALFAVILWGELAAWKISADLALQLEPLEAKLAATSQAHDEARHFYVMYDYLELLGDVPTRLSPGAERVLVGTLQANSLAKKLMGMQMMIEPMALTLFQAIREAQTEPVLCDLLKLYERDEARHVALGVLHLPKLLKGMTLLEAADVWTWEFREFWAQIDVLREMEPHFEALGIDPLRILELGRTKQLRANQLMMDQLGYDLPVQDLFLRFFDARSEWEFPSQCTRDELRPRLRHALQQIWRGQDVGDETPLHVVV